MTSVLNIQHHLFPLRRESSPKGNKYIDRNRLFCYTALGTFLFWGDKASWQVRESHPHRLAAGNQGSATFALAAICNDFKREAAWSSNRGGNRDYHRYG